MLASTALWIPLLTPQDPTPLPGLPAGETIEGRVADGDGTVRTSTLDFVYRRAPTVGDAFAVEFAEGGPYSLELRSHFFDAYLVLRDEAGRVLAEDDDGLIGRHARIAAELEPGRRYRLEACALHGKRGAYSLALLPGRPEPLTAAERARAELGDAERRVAAVEAALGAEHADTAASLDHLAALREARGDYRVARAAYERALAVYEAVFGPGAPETAGGLDRLADLHWNRGDYRRAKPLYERALAISEEVLGPAHHETARRLSNLGTLLYSQGEFAAAAPLYELSLIHI